MSEATKMNKFPWQQFDVLMVDNMLASHRRESYNDERRIVTAWRTHISGETVYLSAEV